MRAREFLEEYRIIVRERRQRLEHMQDLEERLTMIRSIDYFSDRVKSSPRSDAIPNAVAELVDEQQKIAQMEVRGAQRQKQISAVIEAVKDPQEREVLYWRYINAKKMDQIAKIMYISERQLYRIAGEAEKHVEEILEKCHGMSG